MRTHFPFEKAISGDGPLQKAGVRVAAVTDVDPSRGEIQLRWLDGYGTTTAIYNGSECGVCAPPTKNMVCLVALTQGNYPHILRYIPVGYAERVEQATIRQVRAGEYFIESFTGGVDTTETPVRTGTEFYMNNAGDVIIATAYGDTWQIRRDDNLLFERFANYELQTEAARLFFGVVKRLVDDETKIITQADVPLVAGGTPLTEARISVVEKLDTNPTAPPGFDDPAVELIMGHDIDASGEEVKSEKGNVTSFKVRVRGDSAYTTIDADGNVLLHAKTLHVTTSSGVGFEFKTEDNGDVSVTVKGGQTITINADHVELGKPSSLQRLVDERFLSVYNAHTHVDAFGLPTMPPSTAGAVGVHTTTETKAS